MNALRTDCYSGRNFTTAITQDTRIDRGESSYNRIVPNRAAFTHIDPDSFQVFDDLRRREPIFHTPEFGTTLAEFERATTPEYWEVGASGRRYSREFILHTLERVPPIDAVTAGWQSFDYGLRRLGPDTYLFTYTLRQGERLSRRATIWQATPIGWSILYHQGTMVSAEEDDVVP